MLRSIRIQKCVLQGKVATLIKRGGLSAFGTLAVAHYFVMLPTKNYRRAFRSLEDIVCNIVSFSPRIQ